jgi:hypothetical protein
LKEVIVKRILIVIVAVSVGLAAFAAFQELAVDEAVICKAVVDRMPQDQGETFPADVGHVYCFCRISGASEATTITHVWKKGETEMAAVELSVGASPWRTWSSKTIDPGWTGAWAVEIKDAEGNVLKTLNFVIE